MITVFGEGRGFRVIWLLEEMGLAHRLRPVISLPALRKTRSFWRSTLRVHSGDSGRRRHHGRVDCDHGVADGPATDRRRSRRPRTIRPSPPTSSSSISAKPVWPRPSTSSLSASIISVTYALELAQRIGAATLGEIERLGVTRVLSYQIVKAVNDGQLVTLLKRCEPPPSPVNLIYRPELRLTARVRAFIDFAVPKLRARGLASNSG